MPWSDCSSPELDDWSLPELDAEGDGGGEDDWEGVPRLGDAPKVREREEQSEYAPSNSPSELPAPVSSSSAP